MDTRDITLREIVQSSVSDAEPNSMKDGHKTSKRWFGLETSKSTILETIKGLIHEKWNVIFVISCLFAVLTDPLFLYIPLINQDVKCIRLDKNLKIAAVLFRSFTDFVCIVKIIFQIYELKKVTVTAILRSYILLDILAILPLPQVIILIYFTKMRGSGSLNTRKFLNFLVLIQYVPRILRIYLACKEIKNPPDGKLGLWIKGGLNFLMYIFAGHIFGGFWYFFSVQRMIDCWQYACRDEDGCKPSTFNCQEHPSSNIIKLVNDSCPISPSNATVFDFGIFLNALQSGLVGPTDYSRKFSNCFWWGLRNLSSLGSNLQPSTNTWENLFAAFTSITGLLLFLYLLGKLQMYMQVESTLRWTRDLENMMRTERKMRIERSKGPEVEQWLVKNGLPMRLMPEIMEKVVQVDLAENREVNVENILSILPVQLQSYISDYQKKLEQEAGKIELWLSENRLPRRLKTEIFEAVTQRPEFETNGVVYVNSVLTSMLPSQLTSYIQSYMQKVREKDDEIGSWLSKNELPEYFKSEIMEAVLLNLEEDKEVDVENILSLIPLPLQEHIRGYMRLLKTDRKMKEKDDDIDMWLLKNGIPGSKKSDIKKAVRQELNKDVDTDVENFLSTVEWIQEFIPFNRLKKVKLLEVLDERVLKAICEHLKPVNYNQSTFIIQEGQPLEMLLFVEGSVYLENKGDVCYLDAPLIWGEELLVWPSSTSFPAELPVATDSLSITATDIFYPGDEVTALVLTATDMESIGSTFRPQFELLTSHWLTWLKKVPKLQRMDDEVLKAIFMHLKQDRFAAYSYKENKPILAMNFIIQGCMKFTRDDNDHEELFRRDGEVYGEELLDWVSDTSFPALTPFATHTLNRDNDNPPVVLSITAEELKSVASQFRSDISTLRKESQPDLSTVVGFALLKKIPKLEKTDEEVLKAISQHIKFKRYEYGVDIIKRGEPLDRMLFLWQGSLLQIGSHHVISWLVPGDFFGEELIDQLARCSRPLTDYTVTPYQYSKETHLLVVMADDLESVVSRFKSHFS